eukprot:TRINITY_DN12274_c0_g1_i3.p1 TRINITY_DN12274_c0_g1~~TRINITY_DN12274_c0_g1_i3.p1  ORF type:complete len:223 (-),score=45.28 TRINITY_DN12274_c0_g1_i3:47-715(-)
MKIVGGTNDISDELSPTFGVKEIILQDYNDVTKINDVALLRLDTTSYDLERRTQSGHPTAPVPLCKESFEPEGRSCTVSGWGHLKSKGSSVPDRLREVSVRVLHDSVCKQMLHGYPWDTRYETMLCAGGEDKDACQGDSGGPMVCQDDAGDSCIAGVVSWGVGVLLRVYQGCILMSGSITSGFRIISMVGNRTLTPQSPLLGPSGVLYFTSGFIYGSSCVQV